MRRPARFTEADLSRAIKAAKKAELPIGSVRILPDGTILVIPGQPETQAPSPNPWDSP